MQETFEAVSRYDRHANPEKKCYRFLTLNECKALDSGNHAQILDQFGRVAEVKITSVKTWKTRPDVQIGWKFGLYEYGKELITQDSDNRFLVTEVR